MTLVVQPSNPEHRKQTDCWAEYRKYIASVPGLKIVIVQDEAALLDAALFMDNNECESVIAAARNRVGLSHEEALDRINDAAGMFAKAAQERFQRDSEFS